MRNHIKIYHSTLGLDYSEYRTSELSNAPGIDLHHIDCKGMGGDPTGKKDRIENVMALTREEHIRYGDKKQYMSFLYTKHMQFLQRRGIPFDKEYFQTKIKTYETTC